MKKLASRRQRILFLDYQPRLGEPSGLDCFQLHWEFWLQMNLTMSLQNVEGWVSDENAFALADMIEASATDESWRIHMYFWGDEEGTAVKSFTKFLRGGGFAVVGP